MVEDYLLQDLAKSSVAVQGVQKIQPSLEDVFVTLTKNSMLEEENRLKQQQQEENSPPLASISKWFETIEEKTFSHDDDPAEVE
jgi:hypothetical protein